VCAITGKISTDAVKIGDIWISKDGINKLIQYMDQYNPGIASGIF